ncbi:MAG: hypothetical protein QGD89_00330 [Actinomycetota bacterium]|nr:hypothetical protein [Actinomycetota bacterium]
MRLGIDLDGVVAVLLIDAMSGAVRRRIITGQPSRSLIARWMTAITGIHRRPRLATKES